MNSFTPFWKRLGKGVKEVKRSERRGEAFNKNYYRMFKLADSIHNFLEAQIVAGDTAYVADELFQSAGMGSGHDFSKNLENGNCIILDKNKEKQVKVLRQHYSRQKGFLDGWGGRLYFLPGQKYPFLKGTNWMS
jgi:hypothetical protein